MPGARSPLRLLLALPLFSLAPLGLPAQTPAIPPPSADIVEILATTQQKVGDTYLFQGNVEIRYRGMTLTADEVTYNEKTRVAEARGHVVFERDDDHLEATEGRYELATGAGVFQNVEGTAGLPPPPNSNVLVTSNPFYFKADRVERRADGSYLLKRAWVTNCRPGRPKWRMVAARARIQPGDVARLYKTSFLIRGVPVLYSPYAAISIADEPRQSGFLWPTVGNDSLRGTNAGTSYFWAINPHADLHVGAEWFNQGGWTQFADFRALPSASSRMRVTYFGAIAGKLRGTQQRQRNIGIDQSGQSAQIYVEGKLPHGFRGVVDLDFLSSLRFRLGFAETFGEAVRSEVTSRAFVTNNPDTFYFNGYVRRYQNFLRADPESSVTLISAPAFDAGTHPRRLRWFERQPLYFSLDAHAGGARRDEPRYRTPELVQRYEIFPRVSMPFRLGRYFNLTPTVGVRASRYGARVVDDASMPGGKRVLNQPVRRVTEEVSIDLRFPSLGRIFEGRRRRYKHVLEPEVTYRYSNGVRSFNQILRFDDRDIVTDTHEIEYAFTQRLFVRDRERDGQARELISWRLGQKYYFDPTFRGALEPGTRNVFAALVSLTPFAFADGPRRFSPIVSTLRVTPGGRYDTDLRLDYDPVKHKLVNTRVGVSTWLTELLRVAVFHMFIRNDPLLQPRSNQLGLLASWGGLNRHGFNTAFTVTWDLRADFLPNTVVQTSYNWDCCGVAFSYRRLGLGPLRSQNEYRFAFTIANVATFGTIRKQERLF
ncbi:MAG: LPS assembly protein LptD [Acidobacteria bacterium]|nr:LPS assembly protein LptD [Acidobacteriota bacterium]